MRPAGPPRLPHDALPAAHHPLTRGGRRATGSVLAVPGSTNFAGEFAILAGVFERGWGYAAVGAAAIVLAAMYALRLISAILHDRRESGAENGSSDLVGGELALVLPLVAILAVLSACPALVTERSFPLDQPSSFISSAPGVSG